METSARHSALFAITIAAAMCIDAGSAHLYAVADFSEGGGSIYSYGELNLNSPSSARSMGATVHSWTDKDLPGLSEHYCGPTIALDAHGVVYAFASSSCVDDNGFFPAKILAYDMVKNTTKVYGDVPKPSYRGAAIGPGFGTPFLDESTGVFYVVTSSNVDTYDFSLSMLLEFNPQSGNFTVLLTLPALSFMTSYIFDAESHLVVVGIDQPYETIVKKTAIFDTRSRDLTYLNKSSDDLPAYVGVDPVGGKTLVIQEQNVPDGGKIKTNYEFGHLTCSVETGCAFTSLGELDRMWSGPIPEDGMADGIIGIAWDPAERLLSVQSTGCYNITIVDNNGPFICYSNLGTEKFYQYQLPSAATQCITCAAGGGPANCNTVPCADDSDCDGWCDGPGTRHGTDCPCYLGASCTDGAPGNCLNGTSSPVVVKAGYAYEQATNYNDGLDMNWGGLLHINTPPGTPTAIDATVSPLGGHVVDYAFDNDVNTYYDADGRGSVVKACFAGPTEISTIKFHPRKSGQIHADRMKGGIWKCDDSSIATTTSVTMNTWNQVSLAASVTCSCVSFTFSNTSYGSVAEISIEPPGGKVWNTREPISAGGNVTVHWSWDPSGDVGNCKKGNGNVTIVPGSGGANGQQVASCDGSDGRDPVILYCQMVDALSLQAHYTISDSVYDEGPIVHRGCSTIMIGGTPYPDGGQCCFV